MVLGDDQRADAREVTIVSGVVIGSCCEDCIHGRASRLPTIVRHLHHRVQVFDPVAHRTLRETTISRGVVFEQEVDELGT